MTFKYLYGILLAVGKQQHNKTKGENVMKRAKHNEVPVEYRRNYNKEFFELCAKVAVTFCAVAILAWLFITF